MKITEKTEDKKPYKKDMFVVLCLAQSAAVILIVLVIFAVSRISPQAFDTMTEDIEDIFSKNYDIGGYFTPTEEKEFSVSLSDEKTVGTVMLSEEAATGREEISLPVCAVNSPVSDDIDFYSEKAVMPVSGTVTSEYGYRIHPVYGGESFHSGRDIAAAEGSSIYAVRDGKVVAAGTASSAGNYIKIDHGNNEATLYCHCSRLFVKKGETVRKGDVIAAVGQTGLATGPHLHFEYHVNSSVTDPEIILSEAVSVY